MKRTISLVGSLAAALTTIGLGAGVPAHATAETHGRVTAQGGLVVRSMPTVHSSRQDTIPKGRKVALNCKVRGTRVGGNRLWYLLSGYDNLLWVSARYVRNIGAAPDYCDPSDGFFRGSTTARLNQRAGPSVQDARLGQFARGASVLAQCHTRLGSGDRWIHTASGRWVHGDYVSVDKRLRPCMNDIIE